MISDTKLSGLIILGAIFAFIFAFPVLGVLLLVVGVIVWVCEVNSEKREWEAVGRIGKPEPDPQPEWVPGVQPKRREVPVIILPIIVIGSIAILVWLSL